MEIRNTLRETNPPLRRNRVLDGNSGRYSSMLVVDRSQVTPDNPCGGSVLRGVPLHARVWDADSSLCSSQLRGRPSLKSELQSSTPSVISAVFVTRGGDPACFALERVVELANEHIEEMNKAASGPGAKLVHLHKVDIADNYGILQEYGIKSVPSFLVFRGSELVYAGPLGGRKFKLVSRPYRPQILLIEPDFSAQVDSEKLLKKLGADPFLCLSIQQAIERVRRFSLAGENQIIFDLVLISSKVSSEGISDLAKCLSDFTKDKKTIIAGLVSVLGESGRANLDAVDWSNHYTTDVQRVLRPELCSSISVAIITPIKAIGIERLLGMRNSSRLPEENSEFGLTPDTLITRLDEIKDGKGMNRSIGATAGGKSYVGIKLSAEDARLKGGKKLVP